ncbi:MAG: type II secretion system protein [Planctomycetes bacterium]|nr:type II secretion system protein [Planctomycetota bacterium]
MKRKLYGFTMVELLVVITIIVILSAILFPAVVSMRNRAKKADTEALLTKLDSAIRQYKQDRGNYPWMTGTLPGATISPSKPAKDVSVSNASNGVLNGLYYNGDNGLGAYLTDEISPANISTTSTGLIIDKYQSESFPDGAPICYIYYTEANFSTKNWTGPAKQFSGYRTEFQLWSMGLDGAYTVFGDSGTYDKDNITVTNYRDGGK